MSNTVLGLTRSMRYFLYDHPVRMNSGIYALSGIVINELGMDPTDGSVYIFLSKNEKMIKILHYHNNGFTLYTRRIYHGRFMYPDIDPTTGKYIYDWPRLRRLINGYATVTRD